MAVFYLVFVLMDLLLLILGDRLFKINDFKCHQEHYIIPLNSGAAAFLFAEALMFYLFSVLIWIIFFYLPEKYGMITKGNSAVVVGSNSVRLTQDLTTHKL